MKVISGVIKKVISDEQYELITKGIIKNDEIGLDDTVIINQGELNSVEYLPIKLSYKEVDQKGQEKYTLDEETGEYKVLYKTSPILYAYGKELRILLTLKEYHPIKVCVKQETYNSKTRHKIVVIQDQTLGKIES